MLIFVGRPVLKRNRHAVVAECTKSYVTLRDPSSQIGKGHYSIFVREHIRRA
jgi:hypothetical protein